MAFFSRIDVNSAFEVLDSKSHHTLRVSFHHRQIDDKIAVKNVSIEFQLHSVPEVQFFKRSVENIDHFYAVALLQSIVPKCFMCMRGRFPVFRIM